MKCILLCFSLCAAIFLGYGKAFADPEDEQRIVTESHTVAEVLLSAQHRVNAYGGTLTPAEMQLLLEFTGWPKALADTAYRIAYCESKLSPYAIGDGHASLGLFQIWSGWFAAFRYPLDQWSNIIVNATVARLIYERRGHFGGGGWWSCALPGE
jgi:hypothetical protein